jgi:molybdopterin-guanine dinucleotide biosynthesis protein A
MMLASADGWDAIVPMDSGGKLHPVSAYYSRKCLDFARRSLERGECKVGRLLESEELRILRIPVNDFGISDECLFNVNTRRDYERLLSIESRRRYS